MKDPKLPLPGETLGTYIHRLRTELKMSQQQLAKAMGIHIQSVGKIERGQTSRLNTKTKSVCAIALSIPVGYLDAVVRGEVVSIPEKQQFCPKCWTPGSEPDAVWLIHRAKYCLLCGTKLRSFCRSCGEPLASFKHKFCPNCGTGYQE
ncbi:double zinc ribbon domain-containing protein [Calothrix sp. PCC 6303]|uniref:double zinc ribbon domain-containing protein n=1 Tax=Calothrix sp. PCC 6303 TaxID=1170562 RepID=UPI0002A05372|nr:zinc ribbon domain-containing protein [Calothrix sp. PCC 6303]AFZ00269.1 helix-turn-helix domain protein [Calothrix sp. PCC 6303]